MTTTVLNNLVFRALFEKQRLTGPNFIDWYRNLQIVLLVEDKLPFLEQPIPVMPVPPVGQVLPSDVLVTHATWVKASKEIASLMLMTMDPDIQKNLEQLGAYDILKELKMLYAQQAQQELLQTVREFHASKQEEGQSVSSYVLKINSYIDNLERLNHAMTQNLAVSLILVSLINEYDSFMQNYNMHGMEKTVTELHAMLKLHEQTLPKKDDAPALHAIRVGKTNTSPPPNKYNPAKDVICHQYSNVGHWKQNCPQYLAGLLKNKKISQGASTSVKEFDLEVGINKWYQSQKRSFEKEEPVLIHKIYLLEKMDQDVAHMVAASKVPMLKPKEFEIWRIRIEQYIQMIDYSLWEKIRQKEGLKQRQGAL
uniref:Zinc finger, CCHC-type n=1 Tax=Tanacetum cinerariifolium TaxID=118510 RepID=A0A6L2LMG8_TANCI|nr:hypothetical protein [Tanacetum cinerariifolium]